MIFCCPFLLTILSSLIITSNDIPSGEDFLQDFVHVFFFRGALDVSESSGPQAAFHAQ